MSVPPLSLLLVLQLSSFEIIVFLHFLLLFTPFHPIPNLCFICLFIHLLLVVVFLHVSVVIKFSHLLEFFIWLSTLLLPFFILFPLFFFYLSRFFCLFKHLHLIICIASICITFFFVIILSFSSTCTTLALLSPSSCGYLHLTYLSE